MTTISDAAALVLAGQASYDDLSDAEQALVRAEWDRRLEASLDGLDMTETLVAAGQPWAEADEDGNIVIVDPKSFAG